MEVVHCGADSALLRMGGNLRLRVDFVDCFRLRGWDTAEACSGTGDGAGTGRAAGVVSPSRGTLDVLWQEPMGRGADDHCCINDETRPPLYYGRLPWGVVLAWWGRGPWVRTDGKSVDSDIGYWDSRST